MKSRSKYRAITIFFIALFFGTRTLWLTDEISGSIRKVNLFMFVPYRWTFVYRSKNFEALKNHKWTAGLEEVFGEPIFVNEYALFKFNDDRFVAQVSDVSGISHAVTLRVASSKNTNMSIVYSTNECFELGVHSVRWWPASASAIYLYADDYVHLHADQLYAVSYPVNSNSASLFLRGEDPAIDWFRYPGEASRSIVWGMRTAIKTKPTFGKR
jgi:hypothetical protein